MGTLLIKFYDRIVLEKPWISLLCVALIVVFFGYHAPNFKLDASSESLVLENDDALHYYRSIKKVYGSDNFLVITYTPFDDMMSENSLEGLRVLREDLSKLERVESIVCILDVPLLNSPKISIEELAEGARTLETPGVDKELARREFIESPIYKNLLMSPDGKTTVIQVIFRRDEKYFTLLHKRNDLREKKLMSGLSEEEVEELAGVSQEFKEYHAFVLDYQGREIEKVRHIMDKQRDKAKMFLGGIPMIVSDMISFIKHDLVVFGFGVLCFLILALSFFFRSPRWVLLPLSGCFITALVMVGYLGFLDWKVTVISSNFISILLIITISLTIHLIVCYRDLHAENPEMDQKNLVLKTVHLMAQPCFYTALTTIVAFCSLVISDIRPVIDFGWIMTIGIAVAFFLNFIFFPAALVLFKPGNAVSDQDPTKKITLAIASFTQNNRKSILFVSVALAVASIIGISKLEVENRFIDHFNSSTEIYRGMEVIDRQLGGTTPLDIIIDPDANYYAFVKEMSEYDDEFEDEFEDELEEGGEKEDYNYWFNENKLNKLEQIHDYLDGLPEVGKVQSISTPIKVYKQLNDGKMPDNFELSIIRKKLPEDVKKTLVSPFLSEDANQVRITMRLIESDPNLKRQELIEKINRFLTEKMNISQERINFTGMVVLYNNLLQSLFRSQILTIGVVFIAILIMFMVLFKSVALASLAIIPNMLAAALVLGIMGWSGIPLDIMTITIAAITVGIAVDDTIHYVHRFKVEFARDHDYLAAIGRCHGSIGKAIYYTSLTVIAGFSIFALSKFTPTIYFGLLTGLAMFVALLGVLTLLPILFVIFKPMGDGSSKK